MLGAATLAAAPRKGGPLFRMLPRNLPQHGFRGNDMAGFLQVAEKLPMAGRANLVIVYSGFVTGDLHYCWTLPDLFIAPLLG